ncbi:hypothetical protein [Schleiferia thermophila]|uniref:hypothetical protein n=2 Tax=Schleiferia thermophila TaxID=884107 RepID=UPI0004E6181D|nr:hypothetical protein [Schleiferia thermophila]KFD40242.1 hypothetical protein AT05_00545 [Schleiferia thermophila str. Yellowstone]
MATENQSLWQVQMSVGLTFETYSSLVNRLPNQSKHLNLLIFLAIYAVGLSVYSFMFDTFEGGRDNYAHFFISKYSWKYPRLLLDHWGKPAFTLVSSPFAQIGIRSVVIMNVILSAFTGYILFKTAIKTYTISSAFAGCLLLLFSPYFFVISASAMTEMMASTVIALVLYFVANKRFTAASIVFSSLVLIRTETFVFYPLIIAFFIYHKKYTDIPYLFLFPTLYTIAGFFYYNDPLWLISKSPYRGSVDVYGTGSILHFVKNLPVLIGWPFLLILTASILWFIVNRIQKKKLKEEPLLLLANGLWMLHLAAHSYAYWRGGHASMGLLRVLVPVIPAMAMVATAGIHHMLRKPRCLKSQLRGKIALMVLSMAQIAQPWIHLPIPYRYDEADKAMLAALDWYQQHNSSERKLYYYDLLIPYYLNLNPFDTTVCVEKFDFKEPSFNGENMVLYDTRFGAIEGMSNPKDFLYHPNLQLIQYFAPKITEKTFNGSDYEIFLFKTLNEKNSVDNIRTLDSLKTHKYKNKIPLFSNPFFAYGQDEFFEIFNADISEMISGKTFNILHINAKLRNLSRTDGLGFCISVEQGGEIKEFMSFPMDEWIDKRYRDQLLSGFNGFILKIFIWNQQKKTVEIEFDKLEVSLAEKIY